MILVCNVGTKTGNHHLLIPFLVYCFACPIGVYTTMARDVQARLTYLQWQPSYTHTRPYRIGVFSGRRKRNADRDKTTDLVFHVADHPETIRDIRGLIDAPPFDLDINGFAYKRCPPPAITKPYEYSDPQKINDIFLPECEAILKEHVNGADEVKIFDWKVCSNNFKRLQQLLSFHAW